MQGITLGLLVLKLPLAKLPQPNGAAMRILAVISAISLAGAALADPPGAHWGRVPGLGADMIAATGTTTGLQTWIEGFRGRALAQGVSAAVFDAAMNGLDYLPDVIKKDRNQNEFTKTIWDYLDTAVSDDRIASGQAALAKYADLLNRIEAAYGVDKEVVLAIWGLESAYGAVRGDTPSIQALATLAYDGRRAVFFEGELLAALQILQSGDVLAANMKGSWAGAMGHTQFMPTSYLALAVDFTGDGKRNIWNDDPSDALASTAAYLAKYGWKKGNLWGIEVTLPAGFDYTLSGERVKKPVVDWQAMGIRTAFGADLPDHGAGSILLPGGARGAAFLIFANFQVIEKYNTADAYVIAVGHLADRIKGRPAVSAIWPRDLRALSFAERVELQQRLLSKGFNPGGVDGKIGPLTIAAVKAFQTASDLKPDGYPSLDILNGLR